MHEELEKALDRIALRISDTNYVTQPRYNRVIRWRWYWQLLPLSSSSGTKILAILSGDVLIDRNKPVGALLSADPQIQWYGAGQRIFANDTAYVPQAAAKITEQLFAKMIED